MPSALSCTEGRCRQPRQPVHGQEDHDRRQGKRRHNLPFRPLESLEQHGSRLRVRRLDQRQGRPLEEGKLEVSWHALRFGRALLALQRLCRRLPVVSSLLNLTEELTGTFAVFCHRLPVTSSLLNLMEELTGNGVGLPLKVT